MQEKENLEEIQQLIREVRSLSGLKDRAADDRRFFEAKTEEVESLILRNSLKIADVLRRVKRMESKLDLLQGPQRRAGEERSKTAPPSPQ